MMNSKNPKLQISCFILILIFVAAVFGQNQNDIVELKPNQIIEREMSGEQTHRYQFDMQKGEFFQVRVEQKGVDIMLQLSDANGNTLATMDSPNGKKGFEFLSFIAFENTEFVLDISGIDKEHTKKGIYILHREKSRTATAKDTLIVEAEQQFMKAGKLYSLGKKNASLELYNKVLKIFREIQINNKDLEAETLNIIGGINDDLGDKAKALTYFNQALSLFRQVTDKQGVAETLNNIGIVYHSLGENIKAIGYFNQSLYLTDQKDVQSIAGTLTNIGAVYKSLNEKEKAINYYNQSLFLFRQIKDKRGEAATLNNIGSVFHILGKKEKAPDYYNQALLLFRQIEDKQNEARTQSNLGQVYSELGEKQKGLIYLQTSLKLNQCAEDKVGQAVTLSRLSVYWSNLKKANLAIFYGKQSVNIYQELRKNIFYLDKKIQKTYLSTIEDKYRVFVGILIAQGRIAEAEQVLQMLKEEEFFEFLRRDDKAASELRTTIKLTPSEEEAFKRYEEIADQITNIGKQFDELEKESKKFEVGKFPRQAELDKLDAQLADARKVFNKFLDELDAKFRNKETKGRDERVAQVSGTKAFLDSLKQPRTVIISTIAGEERLNLIVTTSKINRAHTVDIKAADLNKLVADFRQAVLNPKLDPRPLGKRLYDVLFPAALQKDLAGVNADTIVWSLDGTLRYVPVAALFDGEKYLAERYANAVITLASRDKIDKTAQTIKDWNALGVGVSKEFETFPALTAVPLELCRVVDDPKKAEECRKLTGGEKGVVGGVRLSDEEFTFDSFRLHLGRYKIVHIASHFSLNPGNETDSYLLLGGGKTGEERKLTLAEVRERLDTKFVGTELLTLSACNTAMTAGENSSGAEIEGFGALAQEQGAKTVLASLWAVADESTMELMTEFYANLEKNPNIGKAKALRRAQLFLLNGKYPVDVGNERSGVMKFGEKTDNMPAFKTDPNAPFAHPYFWSPFVLIGNWK